MDRFLTWLSSLVIKYIMYVPRRRFNFWTLGTMFRTTFHPVELVLQGAMDMALLHQTGGDYLEFGVWEGRSLIHSMLYADFLEKLHGGRHPVFRWVDSLDKFRAMRFVAFDSFEGLSEPGEHDQLSDGNTFKKGQYACTVPNFEKNLRKNKVDASRVTSVPGWFSDSLNADTKAKFNLKKAAIVHIDCDLYEPAKQALDFVTDLVVDGTIIVFDDWWLYRGNPNRGEQRAFREWLDANPSITVSEFYKMSTVSFVVHRDDAQ